MKDCFKADLHCHTSCSDGSVSPEKLLMLAKEKGLQGLSITDHDTVAAYGRIKELSKQIDLELITGIEFSAFHYGKSVHILAYGFHPEDPYIARLCQRHEKRRKDRIEQMVGKLNRLGIDLSVEQLVESAGSDVASIGRPHIANALIKKSKASSVKDAFQKYLGHGKKAFVPGEQISVIDTLQTIRQANAVAIIAHPHLIPDKQLFKEMLSLDFDGLEGYYANMPRSREANFINIAKERNWLITGGSDFHGANKPEIDLGASYVGKEDFERLQARISKLSAMS
ncbi:MAG: PHP domain-containing protein [Chlamydiales bacterium]|nr:PHP domain-containing protein [Chlamydiales bacterium]NCF70387.1 PHP domain-containing protein [Chlamydiales bacterium]